MSYAKPHTKPVTAMLASLACLALSDGLAGALHPSPPLTPENLWELNSCTSTHNTGLIR
jgi:hypothetical protein